MDQRSDEVNREHLRRALEEDLEPAERADDLDDTAEIRAEIEETRSQMGETIDAIQARLSPQHLGEQVKEQVREQFHEVTATVREATIGKAEQMVRNASDSLSEARYGVVETIRQNPIPAAMAAIGLGWLFMNRRGAPRQRYDDRASRRYDERFSGEPGYLYRPGGSEAYTYGYQGGLYEQGSAHDRDRERAGVAHRAQEAAGGALNKAQEAVGSVTGQARDAAGNLVEQARDTAGQLAGQAQHQARRVEHTFQGSLDDNPLGVAAVALALGAAIGFGLPQTRRENELMGDARDTLLEKAQEAAQNTAEKVQQVAGDVAETAEQTTRERAREHGLTAER